MTAENDIREGEEVGRNWADTLNNLFDLAKKAGESFDFERALGYLTTMEELWETKALPDFSPELRFQLLHEKGLTLSKLGRYSDAVKEYERLLQYCQDKKDLPKRAEVFLEIGQLQAKQGEPDRALGNVHRALGAYRRLDDSLGICKSLRNLGVIYTGLGEFEDAETAYSEAIAIASRGDRKILLADLNNNLGAIMNMKGDWQRALKYYQIAVDAYLEAGEVRKRAYAFNNIGITLMEQGQYELALKNFVLAVGVADSIKDAPLNLILYINLTDLYIKRNELDEAKMYCRNALRYLEAEHLCNSQLAEAKKLAGRIALLEKDYSQALMLFEEAYRICDEQGLQYMEAEVLFEKGNLFWDNNRHMEALQALEEAIRIFSQLEATGQVERTEKLIGSIEELYLKIFESMAYRVDQKDHYTKGHSDRVASIALVLARELNLPDREIKATVAGALLHDIGKLEIPDEILKKTGRLTEEEFAHIKAHPELGVKQLSGMKFPWDLGPLIHYHHERFDGKGYPAGISGELIPCGARIICVADVFDALTSERPYRSAFTAARALEVMKAEMVEAFDPVILNVLIKLVGSGQLDFIINRLTDPDEMYHIWAQCRMRPPSTAERSDEPQSAPAVSR